MPNIDLYIVSDEYIKYLTDDSVLSGTILNNIGDNYIHTRKYLGAVVHHNSFSYFIPFSSPKNSDYTTLANRDRVIRHDTMTIIRMTEVHRKTGRIVLLGTLKLNNMIPVPETELTRYNISGEQDEHYKQLVRREYSYIKNHISSIMSKANSLYKQKTNPDYNWIGKALPEYLNNTVDFLYAEEKCLTFIRQFSKTLS